MAAACSQRGASARARASSSTSASASRTRRRTRATRIMTTNDNHTFLFVVDTNIVIDAGVGGNEARFINHSCDGNCETVIEKGRVYIEAMRTIQPGEELGYDYEIGRDPDDPPNVDEIFACRCGSPNAAARCSGRPSGQSPRPLPGRRSPRRRRRPRQNRRSPRPPGRARRRRAGRRASRRAAARASPPSRARAERHHRAALPRAAAWPGGALEPPAPRARRRQRTRTRNLTWNDGLPPGPAAAIAPVGATRRPVTFGSTPFASGTGT